jgi:hypothetical protein
MSPFPTTDGRPYLEAALQAVPRILLMLDRNPFSRTYGCFDREYWHYRTMDFPCGMNEEFVLVLAEAWRAEHPGNRFHRNERVAELIRAALGFSQKSAHADGSCDDYFPHEKALGATTFSLYAMAESASILGLQDDALLSFLARRGRWLMHHEETGKLSNHQALAALALETLHRLLGGKEFRSASEMYLERALSWQHGEGWFQEYEGADPGYQSCSISFLAYLRAKRGNDLPRLSAALNRAVDFAWHFAHPDGSYAGEYGSRNTYHFYPHGFELLAAENRKALEVAELFLRKGLARGTRYFNDDNRMCAHYVYDWFQAGRDYAPVPGRNSLPLERPDGFAWFPAARLLAAHVRGCAVIAAGNKGGTVKIISPDGPVHSDTGPMIRDARGTVYVTHLVAEEPDARWDEASRTLEVRGVFCRRRAPVMTPLKQMVFRILNLTLGRLNPNWLRLVIQKLFITGKPATSSTFARTLRMDEDGVAITDTLELRDSWPAPYEMASAPDATSIYIASSNSFQLTNLLPIRRFPEAALELQASGKTTLAFKARFPAAAPKP